MKEIKLNEKQIEEIASKVVSKIKGEDYQDEYARRMSEANRE